MGRRGGLHWCGEDRDEVRGGLNSELGASGKPQQQELERESWVGANDEGGLLRLFYSLEERAAERLQRDRVKAGAGGRRQVGDRIELAGE